MSSSEGMWDKTKDALNAAGDKIKETGHNIKEKLTPESQKGPGDKLEEFGDKASDKMRSARHQAESNVHDMKE